MSMNSTKKILTKIEMANKIFEILNSNLENWKEMFNQAFEYFAKNLDFIHLALFKIPSQNQTEIMMQWIDPSLREIIDEIQDYNFVTTIAHQNNDFVNIHDQTAILQFPKEVKRWNRLSIKKIITTKFSLKKDNVCYLICSSQNPNRTLQNDEKLLFQYFVQLCYFTLHRYKTIISLKDSENLYKKLLDLTLNAVIVHIKGKIVMANQYCLDLMEASSFEELSNYHVLHYVHPKDKEIVRERMQSVNSNNPTLELIEEKLITLKGNVIEAEVHGSLFNYKGQPAFLLVARDITELKKSREKLKENEKKYRSLFEEVNNAIYITSLEGKIIDGNKSFLDLFGLENIDQADASLLYAKSEDRIKTTKKIQKEGFVNNYEIKLKKIDGTIMDCLLTSSVRRNDKNEIIGYQGIIRDITEEKQARINLAKKEKIESLGLFAGGIAHDFNNILTTINGFAELALEDLDNKTEIKYLLNNILQSVERASKHTSQLLSFSGTSKFYISTHNLNSIIREMKRILELSINIKKPIEYHLLDEDILIKGDISQINQMILNLVMNASDSFHLVNNPQITITTGIEEIDENSLSKMYYQDDVVYGDYAYISIEDNGSGISKNEYKYIFDPFFTTKTKGQGLGLSSVIGIVRAHNGLISVQSVVNKGSKFTVYFPHEIELQKDEKIKKKQEIQDNEEEKKQLILLCDDERAILAVSGKMLERMGFDIITAEDGYHAVELFKNYNEAIKLVILDMTMPKIDGNTTLKLLEKINPDIPVLISSGYSKNEIISKFKDSIIAGILVKPYSYKQLKESVFSILEK